MTALCSMDESAEKLVAKYKGLIRAMINSVVVNNPSVVSIEDLQQAGALALIVALKSYDASVGSFHAYIRSCIRNALLEQANSFNSVVTVDEKVRRQANAIIKMRVGGLSDDEIMARLGIKTRATFLSLVDLADNRSVDIDQIEIPDVGAMLDEEQMWKQLSDIPLSDKELEFIQLTTTNHSMEEIQAKMCLSRSALYELKSSIMDAILAWGRG